jgi:predicted transporter
MMQFVAMECPVAMASLAVAAAVLDDSVALGQTTVPAGMDMTFPRPKSAMGMLFDDFVCVSSTYFEFRV